MRVSAAAPSSVTIVSVLIAVQLVRSSFATMPVVVSAVFYMQLIAVVIPPFPAIRGVDSLPSDGEIRTVRHGPGTLVRVHHQGLLMTSTTLVARLP